MCVYLSSKVLFLPACGPVYLLIGVISALEVSFGVLYGASSCLMFDFCSAGQAPPVFTSPALSSFLYLLFAVTCRLLGRAGQASCC